MVATAGDFAELFSIGSVSAGGDAATVEDPGVPATACGVPAAACDVPAVACGVPCCPAAGFAVEVEDPVFLYSCASFKYDLYIPLV